jgi:RHS repeat-associated protein
MRMTSILKHFFCAVVLAVGALATQATAATITYFHNDLAGSPVAATNQAGQVIWRESYRPYGERTVKSAAASGNQVWFTSRHQEASTGLVYMGARYYDPVIGRFVSIDPVGFDENNIHSHNRYAYANNNPHKYVDPDGQLPVLIPLLVHGVRLAAQRALTFALTKGAQTSVAAAEIAAGDAVGAGVGAIAVEKAVSRIAQWGLSANQTKMALTSAQEAYKGSSIVGHSLSKHVNRNSDVWGKIDGSMDTWNEQGMNHLRDIFRAPGQFQKTTYDNGLEFLEKRLPDGRGARLNMDGTFKGFLD